MILTWLSAHSFGDCKSEIILMLLGRHRMFLRLECWSLADTGLTKHLLFQRDDSLGNFGIFAVRNGLAQDVRCGRGFGQVIAGKLRQSFDSVLTAAA